MVEQEEKMEKLGAKKRGAEDTKLAVSENYVNVKYWNSLLIRDALAYICDYVSAVTSVQDSGWYCRRGRVQAHG